jgi:hypothetical protein
MVGSAPIASMRRWRGAAAVAAGLLIVAAGMPGHGPRFKSEEAPEPAVHSSAAPNLVPMLAEVRRVAEPVSAPENIPPELLEEDLSPISGLVAKANPDLKQSEPELVSPPPPAPEKNAEQPRRRPTAKVKRIWNVSEDELRQGLARVPAVGLRDADIKLLVAAYYGVYKTTDPDFGPSVLLQVRPDFARLPLHQGKQLRIDAKAAAELGPLSAKLHGYIENATPKDLIGQRPDPWLLTQVMRAEKRGQKAEWLRPEVVPVLRQLLMHEQMPIRAMLVDLLAEIKDPRATVVLAERAVFDLSPEVRAAAITALRDRPRQQVREVFLTALRYPWAPAADHAAEALTALDDRDVIPALVTLLGEPDPSAPMTGNRGPAYQRELVQVVHTANCMMCHPLALTGSDPVPGAVPGWWVQDGIPYAATKRWGHNPPLLIRADITFFRQDFSETQPIGGVKRPGQPEVRLDYLVRNRPLGPRELERLKEKFAKRPTYEQKEAVLFALRELTGRDPGPAYEDWLRLYPTAVEDTVALSVKLPPGRTSPTAGRGAEGLRRR